MSAFLATRSRLRAILSVVLLGFSTTAVAGEPLEGLLRRIPGSANVVAVIDVKALYSSPIGVKEGWKDRRQILFEDSVLPKNLSMVAIGAGVDMHDLGKSWNLALVDLERTVKTADIVKAERGTMDVISGRETVWTPRDAFYTVLNPSLVARYSPANRQEFSRWLVHEKQAPISSISPFLRRATNTIGRSGQMVLAIDLKDVFLPAAVSAYLDTSKALSSGVDKAKAAKILASIEGLTLSISAGDDVSGILRIEFTESPAPLGSAAKPLLVEALTQFGAELVDLPTWDATTAGTEVVLKGKFTAGSLTRIMSLFDLPSESDIVEETPDTPKSPQSQAQATLKYYRSMDTLLADLKKEKATGQKGASLWYERYARKIDQLPVLDVDPEMIGFGQWISDSLRGVSTSYYGVTAATGYRKTMTGGSGYSYGGYYGGGGGGDKLSADRIRRQENILADKVYRDTWDQIDSKLASLRKEMTQKYRIEF